MIKAAPLFPCPLNCMDEYRTVFFSSVLYFSLKIDQYTERIHDMQEQLSAKVHEVAHLKFTHMSCKCCFFFISLTIYCYVLFLLSLFSTYLHLQFRACIFIYAKVPNTFPITPR